MPNFEYRLLVVHPAEWDTLQANVNKIAAEGFRYRDTIQGSDDRAILVFEREAASPTGDAWSTAKAAMNRPRPAAARKEPEGPKYPPEEDDE